jgi:hypothetical protein
MDYELLYRSVVTDMELSLLKNSRKQFSCKLGPYQGF